MKKIIAITLSIVVFFVTQLTQAETQNHQKTKINKSIIIDRCNSFINGGASPAIAAVLNTKEQREEYCKKHLKQYPVNQSLKESLIKLEIFQ